MIVILISQYWFGQNYESLTGNMRTGSAFIDGKNALTFHFVNLNFQYANSPYQFLGFTGKPFFVTNYFGIGYSLNPFEASVLLNYNLDVLHSTDAGDRYFTGYGLGDVKVNLKFAKSFGDIAEEARTAFAIGVKASITLPTGEKDTLENPQPGFDLPFADQNKTNYVGKGGIYRSFAYGQITYGGGLLVSFQHYPLRLDLEASYVPFDSLYIIGSALGFHVGAVKPFIEFSYLMSNSNTYKDSSASILGFGFKFGYPNWHLTIGAENILSYARANYGLALGDFKSEWSFWILGNYTYEAGLPRVEKGEVIVFVKDEKTSKPLEGAVVVLEEAKLVDTTDKFGRVNLGKVATGEYTLVVEKQEYISESRVINVLKGKNEYTVLLKPEVKATLTIVVKDADTKQPIEAEVKLMKDDKEVASGKTNPSTGTIVFKELKPGIYSYRVEKENYNAHSRTLELKESAIEEIYLVPVKKEVPKLVKITGKVVDAKTNMPIANARVKANDRETYTDSLGLYVIDSLSVGVIQFGVIKENYQPYSEVINAEKEGTIIKNVSLTPVEVEKPKVGKVIITVVDRETNSPVSATIEVKGTDIEGTTNEEGVFEFELSPGEYAVSIQPQDKAYLPQLKTVKVEADKTTTVVATLVKKKAKITVRKIYFDTGKATIRPESVPVLEGICTLLKDMPTAVVEIEGHTDTRGSEEYNLRLSQARADAVRAWLISHGCISPDRITAVGYGETRPEVFPERTPEDYQRNRRVVIRFKGEVK